MSACTVADTGTAEHRQNLADLADVIDCVAEAIREYGMARPGQIAGVRTRVLALHEIAAGGWR